MERNIRVAILMGGPSEEHEISLKTGRNILLYLNKDKYNLIPMIIKKNGDWDIEPKQLKKESDVAFIAMHGEYGEDGTVQDILSSIGLPHTGSDAHSSALAMNKHLSLDWLARHGINVAPSVHVSRRDWLQNVDTILYKIINNFQRPWVIKPNFGGSSLGMSFINEPEDLSVTLNNVLHRYRSALVQPRIVGREFACGVLDKGVEGTSYSLPPTEIRANLGEFYDYDSKYKEGGSSHTTPADVPGSWLRHIKNIAKLSHDALGCRGVSRTDMIVGEDGQVYVLEVNTIPGLTKTSLLPEAAEAHGLSFSEMLDHIIEASLRS